MGATVASVNKFAGFCRMSVTPNSLHLGSLLREWMLFPSADVYLFLLACIDHRKLQ